MGSGRIGGEFGCDKCVAKVGGASEGNNWQLRKSFLLAGRRQQQMPVFFDNVGDVRKRQIKSSYKWNTVRFFYVFSL